ncbi:hypothetical protein R1sor_016947 [Riccia sorocarpa]|uniref:Uncharacterized protein n=1 Tax=Riccia sorocarpa TaxID=122646 RepID=A0ABD3I5E0_9MARC
MDSTPLWIISDTWEEAIVAAMDRLVLSRSQLKPTPFTRQVQLNMGQQKVKVVELLETAVITIFFGAPRHILSSSRRGYEHFGVRYQESNYVNFEQLELPFENRFIPQQVRYPDIGIACEVCGYPVTHCRCAGPSNTGNTPTQPAQPATYADLLKAQHGQFLVQQVRNAALSDFIDDDCLQTPREATLMYAYLPGKQKKAIPLDTPWKRTKPTDSEQPVDDPSVIHAA